MEKTELIIHGFDSLKWRASIATPLAFLHVDCAMYSFWVEVLEGLYDRMQVGAVVVFDEYFNYPNWREHEISGMAGVYQAS